jgi:2-aminoadipate transaminase
MMRFVAEEKALSLTAGEPFEELYPSERLKEAFERTLGGGPSLYTYSNERRGKDNLRTWIFQWMKRDGLVPPWASEENIFITSGSQEGLHFLTECFVEKGRKILVESPSYPEALVSFKKEGADFIDVPLHEDGPDIEAMKKVLERENISFFYTIPTFQNPTGSLTSDEKRLEVLELAQKHDFLIIEDDPYRHLSLTGIPGRTYLSLAGDDDRVLYMGSFSKIVAPGMRIGWALVPDAVGDAFLKLRVVSNLCLSEFNQVALLNFLEDLDFDAWLSHLQNAYRNHRDAMVEGLKRDAKEEGLSFNNPRGGFFIWGRVPWIKDMHDFARFAVMEEKVGILPGDIFFIDPSRGRDTIRLSFAKTPPQVAKEGCRRLGRALRSYRARVFS